MSAEPWTKAEVEKLRTLRAQGMGYAEIAENVGRTEHACVAKADRIGMRVHSPVRPAKSTKASLQYDDILLAVPEGRSVVRLEDLTPTSCRWPFGDPKSDQFGFCGCEVVEGRPYCAEHAQRAYAPLPMKYRKKERTRDVRFSAYGFGVERFEREAA